MTDPISEAAVEAAAKAIWVNDQKDQAWALRVVDDAFSPADDWTDECMGYWHRAEAALTAARSHMEAEATPLAALASELSEWLEGKRSTHNQFFGEQFEVAEAARLTAESDNARINGLAALIAATIAERTNDEPA